MTGAEYLAWGLFGGFAVEGLDFVGAIKRTGGWPWHQDGAPPLIIFLVSEVIRLAIDAGVALAAGSSGQVSGPFGALAVGVAAPLLVEQLTRQVPLTYPDRIDSAVQQVERSPASDRLTEGARLRPDVIGDGDGDAG